LFFIGLGENRWFVFNWSSHTPLRYVRHYQPGVLSTEGEVG